MPQGHPVLRSRVNAATPPDLRDGEIGGLRRADPAGSGAGPAPRPRHPRANLAAVPEGRGGGHGQAGLTGERTGTGRGDGCQLVRESHCDLRHRGDP